MASLGPLSLNGSKRGTNENKFSCLWILEKTWEPDRGAPTPALSVWCLLVSFHQLPTPTPIRASHFLMRSFPWTSLHAQIIPILEKKEGILPWSSSASIFILFWKFTSPLGLCFLTSFHSLFHVAWASELHHSTQTHSWPTHQTRGAFSVVFLDSPAVSDPLVLSDLSVLLLDVHPYHLHSWAPPLYIPGFFFVRFFGLYISMYNILLLFTANDWMLVTPKPARDC